MGAPEIVGPRVSQKGGLRVRRIEEVVCNSIVFICCSKGDRRGLTLHLRQLSRTLL